MNEQETREMKEKLEKIYVSVEKTRKYFLWTMIITIVLVVLPLIGFMFAIPSFMTNYTTDLQEIGY